MLMGILNNIIQIGLYFEKTNTLLDFAVFFIITVIGLYICSRLSSQRISAAFLFTIIFIATFPKIGNAIRTGLDPSSRYALNYFFFKNVQFGKDVIFTYGPLGFLETPQSVGVNLLFGVCYYFIIHFLVVLSGVYLITTIQKNTAPIAMAIYAALFSWVLTNCYYGKSMSMPALLIATLILNYEENKQFIFISIAAGYIALLFLIKIGAGVFCLAFLYSYLMIKSIMEKKYKLFLSANSIIAVTFLTIWFLVYRNFNYIADYIFSGLQLIKGNESAVSLDPGNDLSVLLFLAIVSTMIIMMFYLREKKAFLINSMFLLPSWLMFKYAFGRQDNFHTLIFLKFLFIYFFMVMINKISAGRKIIFGMSFCVLLPVFFTFTGDYSIYTIVSPNFKNGAENIYNASFGYKSYRIKLEDASEKNLKEQLLSEKMLEEIGRSPVDVYPYDSTYSLANGLNWRSRPVFQSYFAYTPWLDMSNYNFFTGVDTPAYIIWVKHEHGLADSVDGRYLFNDEPKTIYAILNNYYPILHDEKSVLLKRKKASTFKGFKELYTEERGWNEWITVPMLNSGVVRAKIEFTRTLYGKIKRFLWKEKEVFIEYKLGNGKIVKYRIVVDNAASGIWIHPYITDLSSNGDLFFGETVAMAKLSYNDKYTFEPHFMVVWEDAKLNR